MKKLLIIFLSLVLVIMTVIYIFIPQQISVTGSSPVNTTSNGFDTCLHKPEKWKQWWPDKSFNYTGDSLFSYKGYNYKLSTAFSDGGIVKIEKDNLQYEMKIRTVPQSSDSVIAIWEVVLKTGNNPFTKIALYMKAETLKKNIQVFFDSLCSFAGKTENIYGFPIKRTTFTEVTLLAYRFKGNTYPATEEIYNVINKLKKYIRDNGASERYYPMMNSKKIDSAQYETMIAISIDKTIPVSGDFFISRMVPMKDRFLETEVTGGPMNLQRAYNAMEKYMSDRSLSAPARPFEILVTDRSSHTDTTKWITKIFYPSM